MEPVVQKEITGCGIASCAAIAGVCYDEAKAMANRLGIRAEDRVLWSNTAYVRRLLKEWGIPAGPKEEPFTCWDSLPNLALLAIKWRLIDGVPFWHWTVFVREEEQSYVLDSKKGLTTNKRRDFGRIKPKWFIRIDP